MNTLRIEHSNRTKLLILLLITFVLLFLLNTSAVSQTFSPLPTESTAMSLPAASPQIKCPAFYFNDIKLNSISAAVDLGGTTNYQDQHDSSWVWIDLAGVTGVHFYPSCPSGYPYLNGINEQGGGVLGVTFAATMSVTCAAIPNPPVRLVSDVTSWIDGPTNGYSCP